MGFEPTEGYPSSVFKTEAFGHSANSPLRGYSPPTASGDVLGVSLAGPGLFLGTSGVTTAVISGTNPPLTYHWPPQRHVTFVPHRWGGVKRVCHAFL